MIKLNSLYIDNYRDKYKNVLESFKDESKSNYIYNVTERLLASKNKNSIFDVGHIVLNDDLCPIGYVYIFGIKNDSLYVEYSLLKKFIGKGYGSKILAEITTYLFESYNIKDIKLDIDKSNQKSINTALSCGYFLDEEDFERNNFNGKMTFIKDNSNYVSKRR